MVIFSQDEYLRHPGRKKDDTLLVGSATDTRGTSPQKTGPVYGGRSDYKVHGAARSDIGKAVSVIERLGSAVLRPEILFADGGHPSVPSAAKIGN